MKHTTEVSDPNTSPENIEEKCIAMLITEMSPMKNPNNRILPEGMFLSTFIQHTLVCS